MKTDINLNQNVVAECLKGTYDFGGTTIHNVCAGTTTYLPWGSLDWFGMIALCSFGSVIGLSLGLMLLGVALRIAFDRF
jgi:hypothetical protein